LKNIRPSTIKLKTRNLINRIESLKLNHELSPKGPHMNLINRIERHGSRLGHKLQASRNLINRIESLALVAVITNTSTESNK